MRPVTARRTVGFGFAGLGFDPIGVDGLQQIADDVGEFNASGLFPDAFLLGVVKLPVETGEAASEGAHRVFVVCTHHHAHGEILERHGRFGDEGLAGGLE